MTTAREHDWGRRHFHGPDFCRACGSGRYDAAAQLPCKGPIVGILREGQDNPFVKIERRLVDYFDATLPRDMATLEEAGNWYADIQGHRVDLTALATAIAQGLAQP